MKYVTWNVNGIRACLTNGLLDYLQSTEADVIALQETKVDEPVNDLVLPGYTVDWYYSECGGYSDRGVHKRGGYSGTVCIYRTPPVSITHGLTIQASNGDEWPDNEGRIITLDYPDFYFVNIYVPNSLGGLARLHYLIYWNMAFQNYVEELNYDKPVIVAGDFNVAHNDIDISAENLSNIEDPPGFLPEERDGFNRLLNIGMIDVFRTLHPTERAYTWWSNRSKRRDTNQGRRIDYFLVSESLLPRVKSCKIRTDIYGSDHAPIEMRVKI